MKSSLSRLREWSTLSLFGNSVLARLVLLTPAVALYVRLQENFLKTTFGLTCPIWLYWSLILISIGQVIFAFACPTLIKKYGRNIERYKVEDTNARTELDRQMLKRRHIRSFFVSHGGVLEARHLLNAQAAETYLEVEFHDKGVKRFGSSLYGFLEHYVGHSEALTTFETNHIDQIFKVAPHAIVTNLDNDLAKEALDECSRIIKTARGSVGGGALQNDWTIEALDWQYNTANSGRAAARWLVALCYGFGSLYFLYSAGRGVLVMLRFSLGLEP